MLQDPQQQNLNLNPNVQRPPSPSLSPPSLTSPPFTAQQAAPLPQLARFASDTRAAIAVGGDANSDCACARA